MGASGAKIRPAQAATKAALLLGGGAKTKARGYGVFAEGLPEEEPSATAEPLE